MFRGSAVVALFASLAFAAPAGAATLTGTVDALVFTAGSNVDNDTAVTGNATTLFISTPDDPVPYSNQNPLPTGCEDADANQNQSPASGISCDGVTALTLDLGDLNDTGSTAGNVPGLTWRGGPGNDTLEGAAGAETFDGGPDHDTIDAGGGADTADGGAGDDQLTGGLGADTLRGGDGVDILDGEEDADTLEGGAGGDVLLDLLGNATAGTDVLRGQAGGDFLWVAADGLADTYDGGTEIDAIQYGSGEPVTIDLTAGTASSGADRNTLAGVEDVTQLISLGGLPAFGTSVATTVVGDAGISSISTGSGADTVDPRAGNDTVSTGGGDDKVDVRDGYADRVSCGEGADAVQADTLDVVGSDCETVTVTDAGNANDVPDVPEDRAPTVAITAPLSSSVLSTTTANTITATAADDRGIAKVIFSTGERNLCVDETAPYTCDYRPTSADVGRDTLVAIAVDTSGQTASAVRVVNVPRFKAIGLSASTSPKRDRRAPYRFRTRGRLTLPGGVVRAAGCDGTIDVSFKAGKKTVSSRRVALKPDCTYSSTVTFRLPRRLNPKALSVVVVFGGNSVVEGLRAKRHTVRPR